MNRVVLGFSLFFVPSALSQTSTTLLTLCFAEQSFRKECSFEGASFFEQFAHLKTVLVPRSQGEALRQNLCSILQTTPSDSLLIHILAQEEGNEGGWHFRWLTSQRESKRSVPPKEVINYLNQCAGKAPFRTATILLDGTLGGSQSFSLTGRDWLETKSHPKIRSRGVVLTAGTEDRKKVQKHSLWIDLNSHLEESDSGWRQKVTELEHSPWWDGFSASCRKFWQDMLERPLPEMLARSPLLLPNPEKCGDVPKPLLSSHMYYIEACSPLFDSHSTVKIEDIAACRYRFFQYRPLVRIWETGPGDVNHITDLDLLYERLLWLGSFYDSSHKFAHELELLKTANRILEYRPRSFLALVAALRAETFFAMPEYGFSLQEPTNWDRSRELAVKLLREVSDNPTDYNSMMGRKGAWFALTWGAQPYKVSAWFNEIILDPRIGYQLAIHSPGNFSTLDSVLLSPFDRALAVSQARSDLYDVRQFYLNRFGYRELASEVESGELPVLVAKLNRLREEFVSEIKKAAPHQAKLTSTLHTERLTEAFKSYPGFFLAFRHHLDFGGSLSSPRKKDGFDQMISKAIEEYTSQELDDCFSQGKDLAFSPACKWLATKFCKPYLTQGRNLFVLRLNKDFAIESVGPFTELDAQGKEVPRPGDGVQVWRDKVVSYQYSVCKALAEGGIKLQAQTIKYNDFSAPWTWGFPSDDEKARAACSRPGPTPKQIAALKDYQKYGYPVNDWIKDLERRCKICSCDEFIPIAQETTDDTAVYHLEVKLTRSSSAGLSAWDIPAKMKLVKLPFQNEKLDCGAETLNGGLFLSCLNGIPQDRRAATFLCPPGPQKGQPLGTFVVAYDNEMVRFRISCDRE